MNKKLSRKILAAPYVFWSAAFIVIPLCMVFFYGLTDKTGAFTLENVLAIASPEHRKALFLSIGLFNKEAHRAGVKIRATATDNTIDDTMVMEN